MPPALQQCPANQHDERLSANGVAADAIAPDRRQGSRYMRVFRSAAVSSGRGSGLARINNISDGGLMLSVGVPVELGDRLRIELSETRVLAGEVIWSDGARCGVRFDEEISASEILQALSEERSRAKGRPLRMPLDCTAVASCQTGFHKVHVRDISQAGVRITASVELEPGLAVRIRLPSGLEREGVVRWIRDGFAGIMLARPFSIDDLADLSRL